MVARARYREACNSEISRQKKAAGTTETAERRSWRVQLTSSMACRRGQHQASFFLLFHGAYLFRVVS